MVREVDANLVAATDAWLQRDDPRPVQTFECVSMLAPHPPAGGVLGQCVLIGVYVQMPALHDQFRHADVVRKCNMPLDRIRVQRAKSGGGFGHTGGSCRHQEPEQPRHRARQVTQRQPQWAVHVEEHPGDAGEDTRHCERSQLRMRCWTRPAAKGCASSPSANYSSRRFFPTASKKTSTITDDDRVVRGLRDKARALQIALVLPLAERAAAGYFNTALVIDEAGSEVGRYRKTHIPLYFPNAQAGGTGSFEKLYFTPGESLSVFSVAGTRIGVQICNDRLYPAGSRVLALQGA